MKETKPSPNNRRENEKMCQANNSIISKVEELMELRKMIEGLQAEAETITDEIKDYKIVSDSVEKFGALNCIFKIILNGRQQLFLDCFIIHFRCYGLISPSGIHILTDNSEIAGKDDNCL